MQIAITKKLADKMKLAKLPQMKDDDAFFLWRANIQQSGHERILVFMHDASRYVLVVQRPKAKTFQNLTEVFTEALRNVLLMDQVNPDVIDRYIDNMGSVTFVANAGRQETAWLNKACDNAWFATGRCSENTYISVFASHMNVGTYDDDRSNPSDVFLGLLSGYGLPIRKSIAFDLTVRLELDGNDAVRVVRVPANVSFFQLHMVIQEMFNWRNHHLFSFSLFDDDTVDVYYAKPDFELVYNKADLEVSPDAILMHDVCISEYMRIDRRCVYCYDYGDNWIHNIELSQIIHDYTYPDGFPQLLLGSGDAPPEDVGGPGGFASFLEIINDPDHEEYESMSAWAKEQWWKRFDFSSVARHVKYALWW